MFYVFLKTIENNHFFLYLFAPWQETFADAWDGDGDGWVVVVVVGGGGGAILGQFRAIKKKRIRTPMAKHFVF